MNIKNLMKVALVLVISLFMVKAVQAEDLPKVGIPACDEYVTKYSTCLNGNVPDSVKPQLDTAFKAMINGWKTAAAHDSAKATVEASCKTALVTAKQALTAFNCAW